ncbi:uncharacterized protein EAF01_011550 [Botrytis porri]|uniref:Tat pathway signal sequence n=1 Tax=Botrytis porri TaxID=87229 RepID=A0A4Z1KNY9_9HELO|nr:uncharacterized protein EAF01_011550 [Botrytis porri]KAF7884127.1 hypothetical protein EAF01_011550 [Botrytis porri]TGO87158.1 hypothetical protein BPOR_0246g00070 [Botrytis porri]
MRTRLTDKIYVFEEIPRQAWPTNRTPLLAPEYRRQEEEGENLCSQVLLVFVFFIFFISICLIGFWISGRWGRSTERLCTGYISQYSLILEDMSLSYTTMSFNGSLPQPNEYRQDAGQEVDAAWNDLGINFREVVIPATLAARSGITTDKVKINEKYGGGYPANVEGLSHLNCLNLLRQGLWYNYDYYQNKGEGAFENDISILKLHVSQCLDIIRQQLMCTVDIGVMGKIWVHPEAPEAYQDFNTKHRCRDFDAVKIWAEQRQVPADVPADFLQQPEEGETVYSTYP